MPAFLISQTRSRMELCRFIPRQICGHDYGGDRFGGTLTSMVNEREDLHSIWLSFNHTFNNGINIESRLYQYNDEAYYRSSVNRYIFMSGGILDPRRIGEFTATSTDPKIISTRKWCFNSTLFL